MGRLDGKTALITGAARGQGAAHARLFAQEGANVVLADVLHQPCVDLADDLQAAGHQVEAIALDVTDAAAWTTAVAHAEARFGQLDVLVNNAAIVSRTPLVDVTDEEWERVIAVNQRGVFFGMRSAIPAMRRAGGGSIVNISSVVGVCGLATHGAYTASKAAVIGMTRTAAVAHGRDRIRVNAICPGPIMTPMLAAADPQAVRDLAASIPLGRTGDPIEVSYGALFLASDESSFVTGVTLPIDGGQLAD